ncbi:hypothetical protein [Acinetobacter baumannii]|uniref:hypothetical protein n=1 Tax=Acinetobacter baumannii TaxID=470 RepID=UPI001D17CA0A|nr:hypothetical protein [Acinetobacter baumannii]
MIALLPSISMAEIDGRSTTLITSTSPHDQAGCPGKAGSKERASSIDKSRIIGRLAHIQRKRTKNAAGGNPLQAVDSDIGDSEGLSVNLRQSSMRK